MPNILRVQNRTSSRVVVGGSFGGIEPYDTRIASLTADELEKIQSSLVRLEAAGQIYCSVFDDGNPSNDKAEFVTRAELSLMGGSTNLSLASACHILENLDDYTIAQIGAGLLPAVYPTLASLPTPTTDPAFAVVDGVGGWQIAYWDLANTMWILTSCPWANPILQAGHVIRQLATTGAGTNNWQYAMGPEVQILQPSTMINGFSVKLGAAGLSHTWAIRQSTAPGPTAPAVNTYTTVLATGVFTNTVSNDWESLPVFTPIGPFGVNDWVCAQVWPGNPCGQFFTISPTRIELSEDYGFVNAGLYVFTGGGNPGTTAAPTTRALGTIYGLCSIDLGP